MIFETIGGNLVACACVSLDHIFNVILKIYSSKILMLSQAVLSLKLNVWSCERVVTRDVKYWLYEHIFTQQYLSYDHRIYSLFLTVNLPVYLRDSDSYTRTILLHNQASSSYHHC